VIEGLKAKAAKCGCDAVVLSDQGVQDVEINPVLFSFALLRAYRGRCLIYKEGAREAAQGLPLYAGEV
jgi:hypothetical protein